MALSCNEIKDRALKFPKEWENTSNEEADAERMEFLFNLYEKYTADIFSVKKPKRSR